MNCNVNSILSNLIHKSMSEYMQMASILTGKRRKKPRKATPKKPHAHNKKKIRRTIKTTKPKAKASKSFWQRLRKLVLGG